MSAAVQLSRVTTAAVLGWLATAAPALAHAGERHDVDGGPAAALGWWSWDPFVVPLLLLAGSLYAVGLARLWRRAGAGEGIRRWQAGAFAAGWTALAVALVSPLDVLGEVLFSAHMAQHEVLMLVAAPLLVLGRPLLADLWALPAGWRRRVGDWTRRRPVRAAWRTATGPLAVWVLHGLALWIWHLPALYQATLESDGIHFLQHASFLGSATLFWWALVHGRYGRAGYGLAVLYVFTTGMHSGVLGALLTFAPSLWYPIYEARTAAWGLSPLEDQQLAGLLMWVPAGVIFTVLGLALFAAWLGESERRVRERETYLAVVLPRGEGGR